MLQHLAAKRVLVFINKAAGIVSVIFIILIKILHCLSKAKRLVPFVVKGIRPKARAVLISLATFLCALALILVWRTNNKNPLKRIWYDTLIWSQLLTSQFVYLAPLDDNSSLCKEVGKEPDILREAFSGGKDVGENMKFI